MISILHIDDHTLFREGIRQILARYPELQVTGEAGNATEAMAQLRAQRFDLILLDISLPQTSGWELLASIKREFPDTVVLILSMHPEDQFAVRMLKAGAAGYVTKESAPEELIAAIRKVTSGSRYISGAVAEQLADSLNLPAGKLPHEQLSNREFQVMRMLVSGKSLKEIAEELFLSEKTITTYRARILEKLQLRNNVELTHYVIRNKIGE